MPLSFLCWKKCFTNAKKQSVKRGCKEGAITNVTGTFISLQICKYKLPGSWSRILILCLRKLKRTWLLRNKKISSFRRSPWRQTAILSFSPYFFTDVLVDSSFCLRMHTWKKKKKKWEAERKSWELILIRLFL